MKTLFPVCLVTLLLLILLETIFEDSVTSYINLSRLARLVVVAGIVAALSTPGKTIGMATQLRARNLDIFMLIGSGVAGAAIIWYKTQPLGWLSHVISVSSGGFIVFLLVLMWRGDEE